jgi:hypothetical protein
MRLFGRRIGKKKYSSEGSDFGSILFLKNTTFYSPKRKSGVCHLTKRATSLAQNWSIGMNPLKV